MAATQHGGTTLMQTRPYPWARYGVLIALAGGLCLGTCGAQENATSKPGAATLEEERGTLGKFIDTQQIISKERKDWQQGKELLQGRLEVAKKEVATLGESIKQAEKDAAETDQKRKQLLAETEQQK